MFRETTLARDFKKNCFYQFLSKYYVIGKDSYQESELSRRSDYFKEIFYINLNGEWKVEKFNIFTNTPLKTNN